MKVHGIRTGFLVMILVLIAPAVLAQPDCPDQIFEPADSSEYGINGTLSYAQTFTVGLGGQLERVEFPVERRGLPAGPLIVDLRETVDGVPVEDDNQVLASITIASSEIPDAEFFVWDVTVDELFVAPDDVLAIVMRSPESEEDFDNLYVWLGEGSDPYSLGEAYFRAFAPDWTVVIDENQETVDLGFRTYMVCATPAEFSSWSRAKANYR